MVTVPKACHQRRLVRVLDVMNDTVPLLADQQTTRCVADVVPTLTVTAPRVSTPLPSASPGP